MKKRRDARLPGRDWWLLALQSTLVLRIAVVLLVFNPAAADSFALMKSALGHVLSVLLLAFLVAVLGFSDKRWPAWSWLYPAAAIVVLAFAAASITALDSQIALFGAWRRYLGLTQMLDYSVLFVATAVAVRTGEDFRRLGVALAALASVVVAYAFAQRAGYGGVDFKEGTTIPVSTLGQPDVLGGFTAIAFITALALLLLRWRSLSNVGRLGLVSLAVASLGLMSVLAVRNVFLGIGAGWVAIVLVAFLERASKRFRFGLVFVAVVAVALVATSPLGARLRPEYLAQDGSTQTRVEIWQTSMSLLASRPLLGLGPDNFVVGYPAHRSERSAILSPNELESSPHSWIFYYAISAGLVGILGYVCLLAAGTLQAARAASARNPAGLMMVPLAAYLGQGLVNVNDLSLDWIPWVCLGALAAVRLSEQTFRARLRVPPTGVYFLAALILAASIPLGLNESARVRASESLGTSAALIAAGRAKEAIEFSRGSLVLDRNRPEYWSGFGTALSAAGSPAAAATAYLDAAERAPWQSIFWRNAALAKLATGDVPTAVSLLNRATSADPYDAPSRNLLAKLAFNVGDWAEAADQGERAARLLPFTPDAYEAPVQAYRALGRLSDAERLLRTAVSRSPTPHLWVLLAQVYLSMGRNDLALDAIAAALSLEPGDAEALQLRKVLAK